MGRDSKGGRRERSHRPHLLGPRIFFRGRFAGADLRPWGGSRQTLRNPDAPGWPKRGDRTEDEETARRWAWAYVDLLRAGTKRRHLGLPGPGTPIAEAARAWLSNVEPPKIADSTWRQRKTWSDALVKAMAGRTVDDITTEDIQKWLDRLLARNYAISTIHTGRSHLLAFFRDMAEHNPVRDVALPPIPPNDVRAWDDDELEALRDAAGEGFGRRVVEFALATGGRQLELFAASWWQVNEKERTIRYTRQLNRGREGFKHLKGKKNRTTVILPEWWDWHHPQDGLVLPREDGTPHTANTSYDLVRDLLERAGLYEAGVGAHRFRHTYARLFLERTEGAMELLSRSLGHASVSTTENRYGHFRTETAARLARARIYGEGLRIVE